MAAVRPPTYVVRAGLSMGVVVVAAIVLGSHTFGFAGYLPRATLYLSYSFVRMVLAYFASLGFAIVYGYFAATNRGAERVMIPVLDILQSVPILAFFPVAVIVLVQLLGPQLLGPNLACIFLIFTSMAWNMVFGVYESVKSLPTDLREAADTFGLSGLQRFRLLLFPAMVNRLVYNSVLSWTGGWFFLVAAEYIASSGIKINLPGIGSYLLTAANNGNSSALLAGLLVLVVLIVLLDLLLWRPLSRWAEKYRYDTAPSGEDAAPEGFVVTNRATAPLRRAVTVLARGARAGFLTASTPFVTLGRYARRRVASHPGFKLQHAARYVGLGVLLILIWLLLIYLGVSIYGVVVHPLSALDRAQIATLPVALASSLGRILAAFGISFAISFPLALWLTRRPRAGRIGLPLVEIVASLPATAIFPLIVFALLRYFGDQLASILMLTTGMIWYLFFNVLSGMRAVPPDLEEASKSFGVRGRPYYRRVLLPAIFPALITGSITAFGGGWNTVIVAEYLAGPTKPIFQVSGIGQLLEVGYTEGSYGVFVAALFTLIITVIVLNELVWKPLYRRAVEKYRYD